MPRFPGDSSSKRSLFLVAVAVAAAGVCVVLLPHAVAYDQWSQYGGDATYCGKCHGSFRAYGYVSKVDGQTWPGPLHNVHRTNMLGDDCLTCHMSTYDFPTYIGRSAGGTGLAALGCQGCHGREEDGITPGTTEGYGAGQRQRHWRAGVTECVSCHADSNPANKTPVGESVLPVYYANPGTDHPAMPTDPCNPAPAYTEDFAGSAKGVDNDGDGLFDGDDPDCGSSAGTPGEAAGAAVSPMTVTGFDALSGVLTVTFGTACGATDNRLEYGSLAGLPSYAYDGQVCALGNTGAATFELPAGSQFFLIVADDGTVEGSYGRSSVGERPPDTTSVTCPRTQDLALRCD